MVFIDKVEGHTDKKGILLIFIAGDVGFLFFFCKMEKKDTKKACDYLGGNIKAKDAGLL